MPKKKRDERGAPRLLKQPEPGLVLVKGWVVCFIDDDGEAVPVMLFGPDDAGLAQAEDWARQHTGKP